MKIVIAIDSFKGSIDSRAAADAVETGIRRVYPDAEIVKIPIADGGEGTIAALTGDNAQACECAVTGPLGEARTAAFAVLPDGTAVIEMATASGLPLVAENARNPLAATTFGTGELIRAALDRGCREIIIGIGGSATNDGGAGMAQALGASLRDEGGRELGFGGGQLGGLRSIDVSGLDKRLAACKITVACDVRNPLCGPNGASAVYGPQKGTTPEMVQTLDKNLAHYAQIIRETLGCDISEIPGAGAAGGLGAGLVAFCGAVLMPGIDIVMERSGLHEKTSGADLVITGEGRIDASSAFGKAPAGVARIAKRTGTPVIALCGGVGAGAEGVYACGIDAVVPIVNEPMPLEAAMQSAARLLTDAAERVMRIYRLP